MSAFTNSVPQATHSIRPLFSHSLAYSRTHAHASSIPLSLLTTHSNTVHSTRKGQQTDFYLDTPPTFLPDLVEVRVTVNCSRKQPPGQEDRKDSPLERIKSTKVSIRTYSGTVAVTASGAAGFAEETNPAIASPVSEKKENYLEMNLRERRNRSLKTLSRTDFVAPSSRSVAKHCALPIFDLSLGAIVCFPSTLRDASFPVSRRLLFDIYRS